VCANFLIYCDVFRICETFVGWMVPSTDDLSYAPVSKHPPEARYAVAMCFSPPDADTPRQEIPTFEHCTAAEHQLLLSHQEGVERRPGRVRAEDPGDPQADAERPLAHAMMMLIPEVRERRPVPEQRIGRELRLQLRFCRSVQRI